MSNARDITSCIRAGLARRYRAERRFKAYGIMALVFAGLMLLLLLMTIIRPGLSGMMRHELQLAIAAEALEGMADGGAVPDYHALAKFALRQAVHEDIDTPALRRALYALAGDFAALDLKHALAARPKDSPNVLEVWVPLSDNADQYLKGHIARSTSELDRALTNQQLDWLDAWKSQGRVRYTLNHDFFTRGDSRSPEAAGYFGAIVGSLLTLIICLAVALPVAVMAAITLEEFARKTRVAELLEIVINNLAAVPSIIYGLLGLSIYLQWLHLPRSSPLVGGLTLAMLIMPVMIIAARAAIRAVPPSMRQAAAALGATRLQVVRHHVLPYALPGIMTGTILSICRALGETAPLLMIGMVAFVADIPRGPTDPATTMPVQIYLWASSPELGFIEKTSSAILVLLAILLILNALAIRLRNRSQLTWN